MNTQDLSDQILNELEQNKVFAFCEDKVMFEAVKKYLLVYLYQHGTASPGQPHQGNVNWALSLAFNAIAPSQLGGVPRSDAELGADLRAVAKGIQVIESGFKELQDFKPKQPEEKTEAEHI